MDKCTHEVRKQRWKNIINQCLQRPEGMTVKQWLDENNICEQTYYHWLKRIRQETYELATTSANTACVKTVCSEVAFAEVPLPDVPIDNSASERAIRTFCLGKKNWMFHNTANGAHSSALVYSISETAKLDYLMPWSKSLPEECRKPRRS